MDEKKVEVVRVKAKKYDGLAAPHTKHFSVDPELTNFNTLREIISKAFSIEGGFVISYCVRGRRHEYDKYLPMLCDWDLNTAVYAASTPQMLLKVDLKPFETGLEEWDIIETDDVLKLSAKEEQAAAASSKAAGQRQSAASRVAHGFSWLTRASSEPRALAAAAAAAPLSLADWSGMLDAEGRLICDESLRLFVYRRGVDGSLRSVVWRFLLNVYPNGLTGLERIDYTKQLGAKYECLKECWQRRLRSGRSSEEMRLIANAVRKDVLRTDRSLAHFAGGGDDNANVLALFNLLTTYALCHPDVAYCQGMSDLASPLLVVERDEAQAYVCFCALMLRLRCNFACDGRAITRKFQHLGQLLQYYDPVFFEYLKEKHADDLLFCYRWLLLELKREFAFDDALLVLESMWASVPPDAPVGCLPIYELDLTLCDDSTPFSPRLNFEANNRAVQLLHMASAPTPPLPDSDDELSESADSFSSDGGDLIDLDAPVAASAPIRCEQRRRSSTRTLLADDAHFSGSYDGTLLTTPEPPIDGALPFTLSCPGNLNGLCHATLVRSLMLGKSTATSLHSGHLSQPTDFAHTKCPPELIGRAFRTPDFTVGSLDSGRSRRMSVSPVPEEGEPKSGSRSPSSQRASTSHSPARSVVHSAFGTSERRIRPSRELPVADAIPPVAPTAPPASEASPVPIAAEATATVDSAMGDLTLHDIFDLCVTQVSVDRGPPSPPASAAARSRQTSGDPTRDGAPSVSDSGCDGKSRHPSSTTARSVARDSGYSGATTPFVVADTASLAAAAAASAKKCTGADEEFVTVERRVLLPQPADFGEGNPFMLFVCVTLLMDHRERIMQQQMDFNDMAIHFDKLARRHSAAGVLRRARSLFDDYLKSEWFESAH